MEMLAGKMRARRLARPGPHAQEAQFARRDEPEKDHRETERTPTRALSPLSVLDLSRKGNILVRPPNTMLDFDNLLRAWKPGTSIAIVPSSLSIRRGLVKYYEAETGRKAIPTARDP